MKSIKIKSFCKVNLTLKVLKKLNNGYHRIESLITFCEIFDLISISVSKNAYDTIFFSGKFKKGINNKKNTVTKLLDTLRNNKYLEKKKIQHKYKKKYSSWFRFRWGLV